MLRVVCLALLVSSLVCTAGCSDLFPEARTGELQMLVMSYDAGRGRYGLDIGTLTTLKNLRTMEGDAVQIIGGASITIDYDEIARENPQTVEETHALTMKEPGGPVDFAWFEVDGVIHPEDFHSLNIATTYYNFERSHLYFARLGVPLFNLPVLYFPEMREGPASALVDLHDNAYWDPVAKLFAVLPFQDVRELPMGMNLGVIAHEYAHAVFSSRVFTNPGVPWMYTEYFAAPEKWLRAMNINRSINEGLADYFGAVVSGDPAFLRKSLSDHAQARRLDPDEPRCLTRELRDALHGTPHAQYNPYPVGSVLSAVLWESLSGAPIERRDTVAQAMVDAMALLEPVFAKDGPLGDRVTLVHVLDVLVSAYPAGELKAKLCGLMYDRFSLELEEGELRSCGESVRPLRVCR